MPKQNKQFDMIQSIEEAILARSLKPGDRLPSERMLKEKYGISRGTIREALKALEQRGLIEIRKGAKGGSFVKEMDPEYASRTLALLIRHGQVSIEHICDFREVIEEITAAYAAERATPEDIERLRVLLRKGIRLTKPGQEDLAKFYDWELGMHLELARISRNPLFEWTSGTLHLNFKPYVSQIEKYRDIHLSSLADWKEIVEAMERREVMRVASIVKGHVLRLRTRFTSGELKQ